jgi:hypothetical protein
VLTNRGRSLLMRWYPEELSGIPIAVIPCCVDRERASIAPLHAARAPVRAARPLTLGYAGKLGGLYMTASMVRFFGFTKETVPASRFEVWTQSDPGALKRALQQQGILEDTLVGYRSPADLLLHLGDSCDAAVSFIRPCISKAASSPTKIPEYLAAGLPVVTNCGIGDMDELMSKEGVGITIPDFSDESLLAGVRQLLGLLGDQDVHTRCRHTAEKYFDLEKVGWRGYGNMYEQIERG